MTNRGRGRTGAKFQLNYQQTETTCYKVIGSITWDGLTAHRRISSSSATVRARWGSALTTQSDVMARCGSLPSRHVKKDARGVSSATKDAVGSAAGRQSSFPALWVLLVGASPYIAIGLFAGGSSGTFFASISSPCHALRDWYATLPHWWSPCACLHGKEPSISSRLPEFPLETRLLLPCSMLAII